MKSINKKCFSVVFFIVYGFLSFAQTNVEIQKMYQDDESALLAECSKWILLPCPKDAGPIFELGYIRSKSAVSNLLPVLDLRPNAPVILKKTSENDTPFARTTGGVKIYSAGPSSALRDVFPAFKAILRIGVPFDICRGSLHDPTNGNNFFMLACLLKLSGGDYCNLFFENTDSKWPSFPGFPLVAQVVLTSPRAKVFSTYECHGSQVAARYDAMQDELIARFKSQLASGDAELADTIYTMGFIRSDRAMPLLIDNLKVCPQVSTNAPSGFAFPAAEALVSIAPPLGICFEKLEATASMSLEESLWLRITHEDYPEALEYDLMKKAEAGDARAKRLLQALPWRRLVEAEMSDERGKPQ